MDCCGFSTGSQASFFSKKHNENQQTSTSGPEAQGKCPGLSSPALPDAGSQLSRSCSQPGDLTSSRQRIFSDVFDLFWQCEKQGWVI
jgi:hypothetical protein